MLAGLAARLYMNDYVCSAEFNETILLKEGNDLMDICSDERFQFGIGYIPGREQPELVWSILEIKGVNKIGVFGGDNAVVSVSKTHNRIVVSQIATWEIERVKRSMPVLLEETSKATWQLSVNDKVHPATATIRLI